MSIIQENVVLTGIMDGTETVAALQTNAIVLQDSVYSGAWVLNDVVDEEGASYVESFAVYGSTQIGNLAVNLNGLATTNLLSSWAAHKTLTASLTVDGHATSTQIHLCTLPVLDLLLFDGGSTFVRLECDLSTTWFDSTSWTSASEPSVGSLGLASPSRGDSQVAAAGFSGAWDASARWDWSLLLSVSSVTGYTSHSRFDGSKEVLRISSTGAPLLTDSTDPTSVVPFKLGAYDATVYDTEVVSGSGLTQPHLYLRTMRTEDGTALTGYSWFRNQQSGGSAISGTLPDGAVATATLTVPGDSSETIPFGSDLELLGPPPSSVDWSNGGGETTGVTAVVAWGSRPQATTPAFTVDFRQFEGTDGYRYMAPQDSGMCTLAVAPVTGLVDAAWNYAGIAQASGSMTLASTSPELPASGLSALNVGFGSLPLDAAATAVLDATVQRSDGSHPQSVVRLDFGVTEVAMGGTAATGGSTATGGTSSSGGTTALGGGATALGGTAADGGATAIAAGGTLTDGGATATFAGGTAATGASGSTGGTTAVDASANAGGDADAANTGGASGTSPSTSSNSSEGGASSTATDASAALGLSSGRDDGGQCGFAHFSGNGTEALTNLVIIGVVALLRRAKHAIR